MSSGGEKNDGYTYEYVPASMCYDEQATTQFADLNMDQMKAMVVNAKPGEVHSVAGGWRNVNNDLVGEDGGGGSRHDFLTAVYGVLEHWEGDAADRFKARAEVIAQKMQDGAKYAKYTSIALGNAATVLETIKPEVEAMEKPGTLSSAGDFLADGFSHDDSGYQADKRAGMSTQDALEKNKDDLSAGKEAQLRMAVKMEELGAAYASQAKAMGSWNRRPPVARTHDKEDYPGDPGGIVPTPIVAIPTESGPRLVGRTSTSSGSSSGSVRSTITTSPSTPHRVAGTGAGSSAKASAPSGVGTDVDGLATTSTRGTGTGVGGGHGGGVRAGGAGGGSGTGADFPDPLGGPAGGLARGGTTPGAGSAASGGRMGTGGAGAGVGTGAGRGERPGGRAPLARTKGGVIGEAEGTPSPGARAGSGLHGSRGGTTEGRRAAGLSGSPQAGVAGQGRDKKKKERKAVPGYLVEDEETWVPKQDVTNPRVIE